MPPFKYTYRNAKEKTFFDNLWDKYGLTLEYFRKNYYYCGGTYEGHRRNYFMLKFSSEPPRDFKPGGSKFQEKCSCGTPIQEQVFVYDKKRYEKNIAEGRDGFYYPEGIAPVLLVIGNECIKRECPNAGRLCDECNAPHKNRKDNLCNDCRNPKVCITCKKKMPKIRKDGTPNPFVRCYQCNAARKATWGSDFCRFKKTHYAIH